MISRITLVNHRDPSGTIQMIVAALPDGMIIGSMQRGIVQMGIDPTKQEVRCFIDNDSALAYLKLKCRGLLGRDDVDFYIKEGDPIIQQSQQMPQQRRVI
jgi:hypothetical protein